VTIAPQPLPAVLVSSDAVVRAVVTVKDIAEAIKNAIARASDDEDTLSVIPLLTQLNHPYCHQLEQSHFSNGATGLALWQHLFLRQLRAYVTTSPTEIAEEKKK
jgi:hypothetical protein